MNKQKTIPLLAFLVLVIAALACGFNLSTANIRDAWMAHDEEGQQRTTTFAQDEIFYALADVANAPDDTTVKAVFTAVDVEGAEPNTPLGEHEITSGSGLFHFSLSNDKLWPAGTYKVDFYLNDKLDKTVEFKVEGSVPSQTGGIQVIRALLARDSAGAQPTTTFTTTDIFYFIIETRGAPAGTSFMARWIATSAEGIEPNYVIDEAEISGGDDVYTFNLSNNQPWPVGSYRVELYINGALYQAYDFTVQ